MKVFIRTVFVSILLFSCIPNSTIANGNYVENIAGLDIHYIVKGQGPVMVVGHPSSGKIGYELSLKPLEEKFSMVYYDSRGTGKSQIPEKITEYRPKNLVEEIEALRVKLGVKKIWLFGHSDQSAIALQYAVEYPKNVAGLILSGTSLVGTQSESFARRKIAENKRSHESQWFKEVIQNWDYMITHHTNFDKNGNNISDAPLKWWTYDEESFRKVRPIVQEITKAGRRKPIDNKFYVETPDERNQYLDIQKNFKNLKTKILIINGKYDTNNPIKFTKELHQQLPNSKLVLIDKAGHFPWIEQKQQTFSAINQWLTNNKSAKLK